MARWLGVTIGVPREIAAGERRVALIPDAVKKLTGAGAAVVVESGAGAGAFIDDAAYVAAGATIAPDGGVVSTARPTW